jgi:anaerobic magnesium-protoporphyrin IX monomethyl ester cyclase
MKVLLVNAPQVKHYRQRIVAHDNVYRPPPLQLGYMAAVLERQGIEVAIADLVVHDQEAAAFQALLLDQAPNLVGISSTTSSFPKALRLARLSKEALPDVPTVLGGSHVTFTATETLRENACVDMVVRGEGEQTIQELVACLRENQTPKGILGVSYRRNGEIVHNPPRPFIQDLDTLPLPARHLVEVAPYNAPGALITSRGCPGRCIFCAATAMSGHRYRVRGPERVVDEMEHLRYEYGLRRLTILDDTFTGLPKKLTLPVCREIKRRRLEITWSCESRVDVATPETLDALREAGCDSIQFGVESGSPKVLATLRKGITLDQVRQAVRHAVGLGMRVYCSFILGHPDETEEDARLTLDFAGEVRQLGVEIAALVFLTPFPGTDVYERREAHGITLHETNWAKFISSNPIISTRHLSREKLLQLWAEDQMEYATSEAGKKLWRLFS